MPVAKVIELSSTSEKSFEDAINAGIARANKTVNDVRGAWVKSMKVDISGGKITTYRVVLKVSFVLNDCARSQDAGRAAGVHPRRPSCVQATPVMWRVAA